MEGPRASRPPLALLLLLFIPSLVHAQLPCNTNAVYAEVGSGLDIKTPNYGIGPHPPNMTCQYVIRGSNESSRLQIRLLNVDLEEPLFSTCSDYVLIRDGSTVNAKEILRLCGRAKDITVSSSGSTVYISFTSDDVVSMGGVHLEIREFFEPGCAPDWQTSDAIGTCYKLYTNRLAFLDAQRMCSYDRSNIMTTSSQEEYDFVLNRFGSNVGMHPWFGINDGATEGTFQSIVYKEPMWPLPQPIVAGNTALTDCVVFDFAIKEGLVHVSEDCNIRHEFICKRNKDGSTHFVAGPRQAIRRGQMAEVVDLTVWILVIIALIVLLVLFCICCKEWIKRQFIPNRVEASENRMTRDMHEDYQHTQQTTTRTNNTNAPRARFVNDSDEVNAGGNTNTATTSQDHRGSTPGNRPLPPLADRSPPERREPPAPIVPEPPPPAPAPRVPEEMPMSVFHARQVTEEHRTEERKPPSPPGRIDEEDEDIPDSRPPTTFPPPVAPRAIHTIKESTFISREESLLRAKRAGELFERPKTKVLDNVSAISLDEFWNTTK